MSLLLGNRIIGIVMIMLLPLFFDIIIAIATTSARITAAVRNEICLRTLMVLVAIPHRTSLQTAPGLDTTSISSVTTMPMAAVILAAVIATPMIAVFVAPVLILS